MEMKESEMRASVRPRAIVVGAGLSGLAAAVRLSASGADVRLFEATGHAGGRCRSFRDPKLDRVIDNGNHLVLSGNHSARRYLEEIGAADKLIAQAKAELPFVDIAHNLRWRVSMNSGPIPWWVATRSRRVPDTSIRDYLSGLRLAFARPGVTVAQAIRARGPIWERFWEPMTLAVLNTTPERGSAQLLWAVMKETFGRGAAQSRPMIAPDGLGAALVAPAVKTLAERGVAIRLGATLKAIEETDGRATVLRFADHDVAVAADETVILATPPSRAKAAAPWIEGPSDLSAIVNAHFALKDPAMVADAPPILGVLGSKSHWIFVRDGVASVTISAADALGLAETLSDVLLPTLWDEVRRALALPAGTEPAAGRILREKRATFDQSPAGVRLRPAPQTRLRNLVLAGDWTNTGLPATIEGAIRSGHRAAQHAATLSGR